MSRQETIIILIYSSSRQSQKSLSEIQIRLPHPLKKTNIAVTMFQNKVFNSQYGNTVLLILTQGYAPAFSLAVPIYFCTSPYEGTVIIVTLCFCMSCMCYSFCQQQTPTIDERPISNTSFYVNAFRILAYPPALLIQNYEVQIKWMVGRKNDNTGASNCAFPC